MGKVGKTFTFDVKVLIWLEQHAKKQHKKESYIVNSMLNSMMRQEETWKCPDCSAINDNQFITCHSCPYDNVLDVKA